MQLITTRLWQHLTAAHCCHWLNTCHLHCRERRRKVAASDDMIPLKEQFANK